MILSCPLPRNKSNDGDMFRSIHVSSEIFCNDVCLFILNVSKYKILNFWIKERWKIKDGSVEKQCAILLQKYSAMSELWNAYLLCCFLLSTSCKNAAVTVVQNKVWGGKASQQLPWTLSSARQSSPVFKHNEMEAVRKVLNVLICSWIPQQLLSCHSLTSDIRHRLKQF